ncbi:hypothetical protein ABTD46_16885 [Acinetobacter baumannii]
MFDKIKDIFGLSWIEFTSFLAFSAVGLSLLYKYTLFSYLGIPWYVNTSNAFTIFVSSLSLLITISVGLTLGFGVSKLIDLLSNTTLKIIIIFIVTIICISIFFSTTVLSTYLFDKQHLSRMNFVGVGLVAVSCSYSLFLYFFNKTGRDLQSRDSDRFKIVQILMFLLILLSLTFMFGILEAKNIWKYREYTLNKVTLQKSSQNWYLLDYSSDKALILKGTQGVVFKVVEYKEINEITPPQQKKPYEISLNLKGN